MTDYDKAPKNEMLITDETPISLIPSIRNGSVTPKTREGLVELVEAPLLEACQDLWDKHIETLMSSAGAGEAGPGGYIDISFDTLSEENKKIALELSDKIILMPGKEPRTRYIQIKIPIAENATVGDVKQTAREITAKFNKQPMLWAEKITTAELKAEFERQRERYGEEFGEFGPEYAGDKYYDKDTDTFYGSKEHYDMEHN